MSTLPIHNAADSAWATPVSGRRGLAPTLPSEDKEAQIFWRLRLRVAWAQLKQLLARARLRTSLVVGLSIFFWCGLFLLFLEGFEFVVEHVGQPGAPYHATTVRFVFHLFFASLNVMLVFSSGIILYTALYNSPETQYLLTLPTRPERVVLHRFQEAVFFSSWGFFLLASPMVTAYGIVADAPWYYFCFLLPLIISFVYIPCSVGAICCLFIVHKLPKMRRVIVGAAALAIIVLAARSIWLTFDSPRSSLFGIEWFQETLHRFRFTEQEWLPSSWLTGGVMEAARPPSVVYAIGDFANVPIVQSSLYLALLIANALFFHLLTVWAARRWFRESYTGMASRSPRRRHVRVSILDRVANWLLVPFPDQLRVLLIKDWRLLRRDPVQWSQFLIFFGLLGLYFLNVDRFSNPNQDIGSVTWVNMVSFLNLTVVGLILSTFTTRFIYPMISLEGHCFWILGLLPLKRDTILWGKFCFAAVGSWIPSACLILISDVILRVSNLIIVVHQLTCVLLCVGLASIAVGLGATMPNFHETSPSKIAAGFGGTLNLVLSALYILLVCVLTALPSHLRYIAGSGPWRESPFNPESFHMWMVGGICAGVVLAVVATIVPLQRGLRAFRRLEFE